MQLEPPELVFRPNCNFDWKIVQDKENSDTYCSFTSGEVTINNRHHFIIGPQARNPTDDQGGKWGCFSAIILGSLSNDDNAEDDAK